MRLELGDNQAEWSPEETGTLLPSVESVLLTSILMRATYSMLKCDYEMQVTQNHAIFFLQNSYSP